MPSVGLCVNYLSLEPALNNPSTLSGARMLDIWVITIIQMRRYIMNKTLIATVTSILLSASILGACSNNETLNEAEPTASSAATMPVIEATATPEPSATPAATEAQESASPTLLILRHPNVRRPRHLVNRREGSQGKKVHLSKVMDIPCMSLRISHSMNSLAVYHSLRTPPIMPRLNTCHPVTILPL